MMRSLPIRRNLPLYMVALTLLLLMLAPTLFAAVIPTAHPTACSCCAMAHPASNSACCSRSHVPAAVPSGITVFSYDAPVLSSMDHMHFAPAAMLGAPPAIRAAGAPPLFAFIPLRI